MAKQTRRKQSRKQSRKQRKQRGGEGENVAAATMNVPPPAPANKPANGQQGGKRRTRKLSPWNKFVQKIYKEMKSKNKSATFSQALKEASKRKKEM